MRSEIVDAIFMREEEESTERWKIENEIWKEIIKRKKKNDQKTMMNWLVKLEMGLVWGEKKVQQKDDELRHEIFIANIMREEKDQKRTTN
jgi:hypothetical protein